MEQPASIAEIFKRMPEGFKPDAASGLNCIFQFEISGPQGGDWNVAVKDQKCEVNSGKVDTPTTTMKISDEDYIKMLTKELDPMTAFSGGRLKIEGDLAKAQVLGTLFEEPKD